MPKLQPLGDGVSKECYVGFLDVLGFSQRLEGMSVQETFEWFDLLRHPATVQLLNLGDSCGCSNTAPSFRHRTLDVDFDLLDVTQFGDTFIAVAVDVSSMCFQAVEALMHNMYLHLLARGEVTRGAITRGQMILTYADQIRVGVPSYVAEDDRVRGIAAAVGRPLAEAAGLEKRLKWTGICLGEGCAHADGRASYVEIEVPTEGGAEPHFALDWRPSIETPDELRVVLRPDEHPYRASAAVFYRSWAASDSWRPLSPPAVGVGVCRTVGCHPVCELRLRKSTRVM